MSKREYEQGTLGWWMDERRGELGLTWDEVAERAEVSPETLRRNADDPSKMRTTTRKGIERSLAWENGSIDSIVGGNEPTPLPEEHDDEVEPTGVGLPYSREQLRALVRLVPKLDELLGDMGVDLVIDAIVDSIGRTQPPGQVSDREGEIAALRLVERELESRRQLPDETARRRTG